MLLDGTLDVIVASRNIKSIKRIQSEEKEIIFECLREANIVLEREDIRITLILGERKMFIGSIYDFP